ncbi:glycosyl transferase family 8 [Christiangramia gaetbulicola]|uniref:Glycosyl transferase family 8 n=1 Tax=Christiangramia gaetbulicola TaxID=703340 RepID=A0A2T6AJT1_9FLAO|nr:glycosyltransferase [Christiangramia gaetbulicola]PTX44083.1 glycosyl transferase family 8 [Christiangramia gaetbulicola]
MDKNKTFVTLLSSPDYLKGVLVLANSLKIVESKYPLIVLMTSDFIKKNKKIIETLKKYHVEFKVLKKSFVIPDKNSRYMHSRRWVHTFDKLQVFGLTEFKKIVFLDSDMLVIKNVDELFNKPHLTFAAASEQVSGFEDWDMPNTGMMVIEPKAGTPEKIFENWQVVQSKKTDFSDQDLIHYYFKQEFKNQLDWRVPAIFNAFVFLLDKIIKENGYNLNLDDPEEKTISVLHFAIKDRPWLMNTKEIIFFYFDRLVNRKYQEIKAYRLYFRHLSKIRF